MNHMEEDVSNRTLNSQSDGLHEREFDAKAATEVVSVLRAARTWVSAIVNRGGERVSCAWAGAVAWQGGMISGQRVVCVQVPTNNWQSVGQTPDVVFINTCSCRAHSPEQTHDSPRRPPRNPPVAVQYRGKC